MFPSFLQKIFWARILLGLFCSVFSFLAFNSVHADDQYNLTSSDFTINTNELNPVASPSNSSTYSGEEAFVVILKNVSDILLFAIPMLAGIAFIIAGYFFIFSWGDSEKISKGKTIIKWNLVALFVAFFSYALVKIIAQIFSQS